MLERLQNRLASGLHRLTHLELLLMLLALTAMQSCLNDGSRLERIIISFALFGLVLSGIRSLSKSKWRVRAALTLGVVALVLSMLTEIELHDRLVVVVYSIYLAIMLLLLLSLIESVFSLGPASSDRIIGAISMFLVMAWAWAFAYVLLELSSAGSFELTVSTRAGISPDLMNEMFYFSSVTLTTLGYGDVLPVSKPARSLAVMEAMAGQMYVAVVIAHLVGQRTSESVHGREKGADSDSE